MQVRRGRLRRESAPCCFPCRDMRPPRLWVLARKWGRGRGRAESLVDGWILVSRVTERARSRQQTRGSVGAREAQAVTRWRFRTRLWTAVTATSLLLALAPGLAAAAPPGVDDPADPTVRRDPATGHARMIFNSGGYLMPPSKRAPEHVALAYVRDHRGSSGSPPSRPRSSSSSPRTPPSTTGPSR